MKHTGIFALLGVLSLSVAPARAQPAGEAVFKKNCAICHTVEAGKNKIGPALSGIVGRKAGTISGFNYSAANNSSGATWDEQTLDTYLIAPQKFIPGTKMVFVGLPNPEDRKALIAYLKEQH